MQEEDALLKFGNETLFRSAIPYAYEYMAMQWGVLLEA